MKNLKWMACPALVFLLIFTNAVCALANTAKIDGHLDSIVGNSISGWLWSPDAPEETKTATVTVTDRITGETVVSVSAAADEQRDDLVKEGKGTGAYGFHVAVDWDSLPDAHYLISLSSDGTSVSRTLPYTKGNPAELSGKNLVSLGTFRLTAYCPCRGCSEGWGRRTSSGALASANHTVAVDPKVIPIGSHLLIDGQEYVAEDIGGAVKGKHIDIFFNTHAETRQHGTTQSEVFLIQ